ncbi:alanine racemase [Parvularcula marina]|uniref:alanine racemase n=1 Tax=Parvularcula marina TaxID=2292771 RepID=UPI003518A1F2
MTASPLARLTVDLAAIGRNFDALQAHAGDAEVAPVLKADAYGVGSQVRTPVTDYLYTHKNVRTIFVATFAEATSLMLTSGRSGQEITVYALNGYAGEPRRAEWEATPVLSSPAQARAWQESGGGPCGIALDIGMNRLGMSIDEALALPASAGLDPHSITLVVMHLSHAGEPAAKENAAQAELFAKWSGALEAAYPQARFSLSNSGGLMMDLPAAQQVVRPGYALYGGAPDGNPDHALETVASFTAPVIMTREVSPGETAGYGGTWTAKRPSRLATIGAGYADGYMRALSNKGVVWLGGAECPVAGIVSMDLVTVDITDAPEPIAPGDRAELFGEHIKLDRLAALAGTIGYELLTAVGNRVERVYTM